MGGKGICIALIGLGIVSGLLIGGPPHESQEAPAPKRPQLPSVTLRIRGSDSMRDLAQTWAAEYAEKHDGYEVDANGGGSGVGLALLIDGKVDLANSTRPPTERELGAARKKTGKELVAHLVGYDALAIYVHQDNPLEEISLEELRQIYDERGRIASWSQLGVKVSSCDSGRIFLVCREHHGGIYDYFRESVLGRDGKFKPSTVDQRFPKDVVALVGKTPCAIGYAPVAFKTGAVKFLRVKGKQGEAVGPSPSAIRDQTYPLSRPLLMCTIGEGTPEVRTFLDWARSDAGQAVLERCGHVPLPVKERTRGQGG
jgi:phosphate transport system substrate-binding protein